METSITVEHLVWVALIFGFTNFMFNVGKVRGKDDERKRLGIRDND
jgi:hypothetical protein